MAKAKDSVEVFRKTTELIKDVPKLVHLTVKSVSAQWTKLESWKKEVFVHRRNTLVSSLLAPMDSSGPRTWDMLVDGMNDQQIKSFQSHGDPNNNEAVAAAWVSSIKISEARYNAFTRGTGFNIFFWQKILEDWSKRDFWICGDMLLPYLSREDEAEHINNTDSSETNIFFENNCNIEAGIGNCWSLLTRNALEDERFSQNAVEVQWNRGVLDTCTAILAVANAGENSFCLLGTNKNEIIHVGISRVVKLEHTSSLPNLMDELKQINLDPKAINTVLLIAEELRGSDCDLITSIFMALHVFVTIALMQLKKETKRSFFRTDFLQKAIKKDIEFCNCLLSVVKNHNDNFGGGGYFCDLENIHAYKTVVGKNPEACRRILDPIETTDTIQEEMLNALSTNTPPTTSSADTSWKPYLRNHLAREGVIAVRDAHLNATRKNMRNQESASTRCMVALSLLVFRHKVRPNDNVAPENILDPSRKFKTSFTIGERLSAIKVPYSQRICIYNHDSQDYEIDEFTQQPFSSKECCFLEPMYVLWDSFSSCFSEDEVKALELDLQDNYTTIFRLNNRTFNLIEGAKTEIKMSTVSEKCSNLEGTDKFRAHVFREVLYRTIKAGAQKSTGASGMDCIFNELTRWGNFGTRNELKVKLDAKTNLLGVRAFLKETENDSEVFNPPNSTEFKNMDGRQIIGKWSAFVRISEDAYLVITGTNDNYQAVLRMLKIEDLPGRRDHHDLGKVIV